MAHFQSKVITDVILTAYNDLANQLEHLINWGNDNDKPGNPTVGDRYLAVDTKKLYFCCVSDWDYYISLTEV